MHAQFKTQGFYSDPAVSLRKQRTPARTSEALAILTGNDTLSLVFLSITLVVTFREERRKTGGWGTDEHNVVYKLSKQCHKENQEKNSTSIWKTAQGVKG